MLLALGVAAVFLELGRMDVVSDNEGQRTAPPAEMLRSDDYVIPTINGETYLNKPPLLYWAIAETYRATGTISALTARIPTAVAGIVLVVLAYLYLRKRTGENAARWAALMLLASPFVLQMMRMAELDVPLTLATFLAVIGLREACAASRTGAAVLLSLAAGVALGAAVLLKGPVPFLFLTPAWLALLLLNSEAPEPTLRTGLRWTLAAFALGLILFVLQFAGIHIGFPLALALFAGAWFILAWRRAGRGRGRITGLFALTLVTGVAVATPWAVAVLQRLSWEYLDSLLRSQVTERTYVASAINSGDPFYFLYRLPIMLAPWGLLLPLHLSGETWNENRGFYRFAVLAGWLSVGVFSLIAGKETEYVLPAVPLLLAATGVHLAGHVEGRRKDWTGRWMRMWGRMLYPVLPALALGLLVYALISEGVPALVVEVGVLTAAAVLAAGYAWTHPRYRSAAIFVAALVLIVSGLLVRSYHYTGRKSPRELAELAGSLAKAGYTVEAIKVYPAFAFYAGTPIPAQTDLAAIQRQMAGSTPYYYVARKAFLAQAMNLPEPPRILTEPYTSKDLILIGNRPLPEGFNIGGK
jgi:4-amino-4-deoxy-L-arabinose transferase-like glycosyltransferase